MRRRFILITSGVLVYGLDLLWGGGWSSWHFIINPGILFVIGLTLTEGLLTGLIMGLIIGWAAHFVSVTPGVSYLLAYGAAALASWVFSVKIVTSRSTVSFLSAVMVTTAVFYLTLTGGEMVSNLINRQRFHLPLTALLIAGLVQIFIHPVVMQLIWRLSGRDRYERVTAGINHTF